MRPFAQWPNWADRLTADGLLLFAASGVRTFAYGFLSVVLGLYLADLGIPAAVIGGIFAAALAGGAASTLLFSAMADRWGRRRVLMLAALLMAFAGSAFAVSTNPALLIVAAIIGTISPSGKEVGPFLSIEQAVLPQATTDTHRTGVFAAYNLVSSLAGAGGALLAGAPTFLGVAPLPGDRALLWTYAALALVVLTLYARLSAAVEVPVIATGERRRGGGVQRSRGIVTRLAALFALDSFAGGFVVQGLVAYWFHLRYGVDLQALGAIFFGTNLCAALSFLAAAPLARRIGLLNTMVFTHLPSNILLLLVPFMPNLDLTITMLLIRNLLSQLDVPTRQSYTMAVVDVNERAAAAGVTAVARTAAAALAPVFSGATLAVPALGIPFLVAGGLKIVYDLAILAVFRNVRPPEERR